ncbi:hypothetical protein, partial [Rhizobium leguminosarum]|uniref:hypothetical protein n=1 Tax=Rhizobium leguminosarum TaxID=384 RepID=UPI001C91FD10
MSNITAEVPCPTLENRARVEQHPIEAPRELLHPPSLKKVKPWKKLFNDVSAAHRISFLESLERMQSF